MSTKTKITAPVADFTGEGPGGLVFDKGVAHTDDPRIIRYCERQGYGIGSKKPTAETATPEPEHDARDFAGNTVVGTELRDAAVDPKPEDYLPPINAGEADPHGPKVVAAGIHAVGPAPLVPGEVTESKELAIARQVLVEGEPATVVAQPTPELDDDGNPKDDDVDRGPLGLSDPGSAPFVATGVADSEGVVDSATAAADGEVAAPAKSAGKPEWVDYAVSKGADRDEAEKQTKAELVEKYGA